MREAAQTERGWSWRHPRSLAAAANTIWLGPALVATAAILIAAWLLPLMTVTRFWLWSDHISIIGALKGLWSDREYFLLAILFLFSMLFPVVKLAAALWIWARVDARSDAARGAVGWLQFLGKWSMLDVFVVALAVVSIKLSIVSNVGVHAGIYVFCIAIALSMALTYWLERALRGFASG